MRFFSLFARTALVLGGACNGVNILMANDDGFGSGNLRQLYSMLTGAGHNGKAPCHVTRSRWPTW